MMQLPIYTYSASVLREKTKEVKRLDHETIRLIVDMFETMHKASGIGLAANQVGEGKSLTVIDLSEMEKDEDRHEPLVLINPVIREVSEEIIPYEEGCLSLPGIREEIERPGKILVKFRDANFESVELEADGLLARAIQHEVDHLNGIFLTDHLKGLKKRFINIQLNKIKKGDITADYPLATNGTLVPA